MFKEDRFVVVLLNGKSPLLKDSLNSRRTIRETGFFSEQAVAELSEEFERGIPASGCCICCWSFTCGGSLFKSAGYAGRIAAGPMNPLRFQLEPFFPKKTEAGVSDEDIVEPALVGGYFFQGTFNA